MIEYKINMVLFDSDFKDDAKLAKFAKDYWQIREEISHMYKLKRKSNDDKEQLDLDKTIAVLRKMLAKHYTWGLIHTSEIRNAIEAERIHRYEGHKNSSKRIGWWDEHEPHR